jgi:hypothetical protein
MFRESRIVTVRIEHLHDSLPRPYQARAVEITCYTKLRDLLYLTVPYLTHP